MSIITATGNEDINRKIKKEINDVQYMDIQYQEAVIEILEKNNKINILILSENLPGKLEIKEFINIITYKNPNIIIIIILEKYNTELEKFLISKGINNIYYNNKKKIEEKIKKIKEIYGIKIKKKKKEKKSLNRLKKILKKIKTEIKVKTLRKLKRQKNIKHQQGKFEKGRSKNIVIKINLKKEIIEIKQMR